MMPVSYGTKEAVYLSNFLGELGFRSYKTVPVNCDSTGAISVIANRPYSSRAKHVALRFFFRELVKIGKITLHHVPTGAMRSSMSERRTSPRAYSGRLSSKSKIFPAERLHPRGVSNCLTRVLSMNVRDGVAHETYTQSAIIWSSSSIAFS